MSQRRGSARLHGPLALETRELLTTLIAIVDSGVDLTDTTVVPYLDLTSAYDAYNKTTYAASGASAILDTSLTHGHGSVVANMTVQGIAAAAAALGKTPDVKIMPIRDTSSGLNIDANALIRGVYWAADHGASVINLSVNLTYNPSLTDASSPYNGKTLVDAIGYAETKGAVVVTAPGNSAKNIDGSVLFPPYADDPVYSTTRPTPTNVLVAAAVDSSGNLTSVSNWGPVHVDLGAYAGPEGFTSYSSAYAAGVAGVIDSLMPSGTTPSQVIDVLDSTVTLKSQSVGTWSVTGGVLNPAAAVARAQKTIAAASGGFVVDAGGSTDSYYQGGTAVTTTSVVNVSSLESPPPSSVFQTSRQGSAFSYKVTNLTPGSSYHVRLDFSETQVVAANQRLFDVLVNGVTQISALDVFAVAGGQNRAVGRDLVVQADSSGTITIAFKALKGNASVNAIEITPNSNLAALKPTTSSSIESWSYNPALAVDYSSASRWSSGQWMQSTSTGWYSVDLQDFFHVTGVRLNWETAYAVDYQIQTSDDGTNWTTIKTVSGNQSAGVVDLSNLSGDGRFIRVYATKTSAGSNNYSLYDFQVFGSRETDLAQGKTATASSSESSSLNPSGAFDNDASTRWSSGQWMQSGSTAWLSVDLGAVSAINDVRLNWEAAYAANYQIQSSVDGKTWTTLASVTGNNSSAPSFFSNLNGIGRYVRILCTATGPINNNYSLYDFNVYGQTLSNLTTGAVATSSTNESNFYAPSMAIDPSLATRWSSGQWMQSSQTGWIAFDLGAKYNLNTMVLNWEAAYAVDYQIQVSDDGTNWTTIRSVTGNAQAGVDVQGGLLGAGRYVRIYCTKENATKNYSLYDVQIYGTPTTSSTTSSIAAAPLATAPMVATTSDVTASASPAPSSSPASARPLVRSAVASATFANRPPRPMIASATPVRASRPGLRT
ncbi:discoidin domain-containing protein [Paludisphaera rhizosphaerae]|uniref:discoidin domain-containing protein n=1 Tax=Paludisphaera rhizosphaerae TaxID=2711216 RepID=UPI0013EAD986|nr:discoidin domain-containing protein [Paludisphaera rhizosphaerae]